MNQHLMIRTLGSNQGLEASAEQHRCSVPVALRAPAPPTPAFGVRSQAALYFL